MIRDQAPKRRGRIVASFDVEHLAIIKTPGFVTAFASAGLTKHRREKPGFLEKPGFWLAIRPVAHRRYR